MAITRRTWLAASVALPSIGAVFGWRGAVAKRKEEGIKGGYFPNVPVSTHDGRRVHFYDDLIQDKIVLINFMYSKCRGVCPGITQNLLRVQKLLEPIFILILVASVTPMIWHWYQRRKAAATEG